jgi:hypothetical protein
MASQPIRFYYPGALVVGRPNPHELPRAETYERVEFVPEPDEEDA